MTDYSWTAQADTTAADANSASNAELQIYVVSGGIEDSNAAQSRGGYLSHPRGMTGAHRVNLADLQSVLDRDAFSRLQRTLSKCITGQRQTVDQTPKRTPMPKESDQPSLTGRELEVLRLIARGYRSQEMGELLQISTHTVTAHIKNMYRKLKVGSRSEAIFEALQQDLLRH